MPDSSDKSNMYLSNELITKILETSPIGIIIYNADGQCIFANNSAGKMVGATVEQVMSQNIHEIASWKKSGLYEGAIKALKTDKVQRIDVNLTSSFGRRVWLDCQFMSFISKKDKYLLLLVSDITLLKDFEHELYMKNAAINSSNSAFAIATLEGNFIFCNKAYLDMWGHSSLGEIRGKPISINKITDPKIRERIFKDLREKDYGEAEAQGIRSDGSVFDFHGIVTKVRNENNEPIAITASYIDISKTKRIEKQLLESEKKFRTMFEKAAIGIAIVSLEGKPIFSNKALQAMLGYTEKELGKMTFDRFTYPDDIENDALLFDELIEGKRDHYQIEKRYVTKDNMIIWANLTVTIITDNDNAPVYAIGMVENITKRKDAEKELSLTHITKELVGSMFHDLKKVGNLSEKNLYEAGKELAKKIDSRSLEDCISAFTNMGLGELRIVSGDKKKSQWIFEGENLIGYKERVSLPQDYYALGFICGAISKSFSLNRVAGSEIECQSMGDKKCRFIVKAK